MRRVLTLFAVCVVAGVVTTPLLAQKTAPPVTRDSDRDGVPDTRDRCRGTAIGVRVDANGCPSTAAPATQTAAAPTTAAPAATTTPPPRGLPAPATAAPAPSTAVAPATATPPAGAGGAAAVAAQAQAPPGAAPAPTGQQPAAGAQQGEAGRPSGLPSPTGAAAPTGGGGGGGAAPLGALAGAAAAATPSRGGNPPATTQPAPSTTTPPATATPAPSTAAPAAAAAAGAAAVAARPSPSVTDPTLTAGFWLPAYNGATDADMLEYARTLTIRLDSAINALVDIFRNTTGAPVMGASAPNILSTREKGRWQRCRLLHFDLGTLGEGVTFLKDTLTAPTMARAALTLSDAFEGQVSTAECDNVVSMVEAPDRWAPFQQNYENSARTFYRDWYTQLRALHEANRGFARALNTALPAARQFPIFPALPPTPPTIGAVR